MYFSAIRTVRVGRRKGGRERERERERERKGDGQTRQTQADDFNGETTIRKEWIKL